MENTTSGSRPEQPDPSAAPTADEARAALDAVAASRAQVAAQMRRAPRWYHVVYGFGVALLVGAVGVQHQGLQIAGLILAAVLFGALIATYRAATGIALGAGPRPWRTMALFAVVLAVAVVASRIDGQHGVGWGVAVLAVVTGVAGWALSRRFQEEKIAFVEERDA